MDEKMLIFILLMHYLCDFVLQTKWQAENKWEKADALFWHITTYSVVFGLATIIVLPNLLTVITFTLTTFVFHAITDLFTSKFTHKYFFETKNNHHAFAVIGFDQVLHYIQLYITIKLLL